MSQANSSKRNQLLDLPNFHQVLIGAPEADTKQLYHGVQKAGAVYRCQADQPDRCEQIPFDTTGNNNSSRGTIDNKSNQWFGASVYSSGPDGVVVACAPRYVYFSINRKRREPVGTCFTATDSFSKFAEYSPCRTASWGFHQQGYCQAGFSTAASRERLFIGAVGSWYWQGQVFSQNLNNRLDLTSSREGPDYEDNQYLGYSIALGDFSGNGSPDVAVGMPRGANLTGKVVLLTGHRLLHLKNLTGTQVGSYFGHSLAVLDVNGDGLDDIVIGAPLHSVFEESTDLYETGRIYVVYQNKAHTFRHWDFLDGSVSGGRFGQSLASLGDVDLDGFGDLAVGAPYAGQGVVFIFRGSKDGIGMKPSQILHGQTFSPGIRGFGFSLSGLADLDLNLYPDLLVGAPDSDETFYFRSRPVVKLSGDVSFRSLTGQINPENRTCRISGGKDVVHVPCVEVEGCLSYTGEGVADKQAFSITFRLDTRKRSPRMFFLSNEGSSERNQTVLLEKNRRMCLTSMVYILPTIVDKLSPIDVKMSFAMEDDRSTDLTPIIDPRETDKKVSDAIVIQKDCGNDNICIPDLQVNYNTSSEQYLIGSEGKIDFDVEIVNQGEDAYEAAFYLTMPDSVDYIKTFMLKETADGPSLLCSPSIVQGLAVVKCDLGNPMIALTRVMFKLSVKPSFKAGGVSVLNFSLNANSSNPELTDTMEDNRDYVDVPVIVETELIIRGLPVPDPLTYNMSQYSSSVDETSTDETENREYDIGPDVTHVYQIENKGPSDILMAEVYILWPSFRANGDPLLYLTAQPLIDGKGKCEYVTDVNPFDIKFSKSSGYLSPMRPEILQEDRDNDTSRPKRTPLDSELNAELDCGPTRCTYITCVVGPLKKKEYALFRVTSKLWSRTLLGFGQDEFEISSRMVARVAELPYGIDPGYLGFVKYTVTSRVFALAIGGEAPAVPAWILILSILAGLLFLAFLCWILYRVGFFHRRRPGEDDPHRVRGAVHEQEPMVPSTAKPTLFKKDNPIRFTSNGKANGNGAPKYPYSELQPGDIAL